MPDFTVRSGGCAFSRLVYIFNLNQYAWTLSFMPHHRYDHTFLYRAGDCPTLDSYHTHYLIITLWRLEMHLKYTISVQLRLSWSEVETWKYHRTKLHDPCVAFNWNVNSWVLATESLGGFFERTTLDDCVSIDIAKKQDYILGGYIQEKKRHENNTDELELGRWMQWASL